MKIDCTLAKRKYALLLAATVVPGLLFSFQNCSSPKMAFQVDPASLAVAPQCREMTAFEIVPKLKYEWDHAASPQPLYSQVMSTPMVGDLEGDGIPEIVFTTFKGGAWSSSGYIRVISGVDGREKWSATKPELMAYGTIAPLLIDIEGDGKVEIIYLNRAASGTNVIALNYDGTQRWILNKSSASQMCDDSLSAADLDSDGIADIVAPGFVVSEKNKMPYIKNTLEILGCYNMAVNLEKPVGSKAKMNIVNAAGIMDAQGKILSRFSKTGFPAVADIYPEHAGSEIVLTGGASFQIYSAKGVKIVDNVLNEHTENSCATGSVGGGQASIGDFDGDETSLEIAVATGRSLTIYDVSGKKIAGSLTRDCSSRRTGVASFDFNGDKKPEIIYADEQYLRIYELDGSLNLRTIWETKNPSGTLSEYPVVADADADGYADLIVAQNSYSYDSTPESPFYQMNGVRVFGPTVEGSWMPTRAVWNQHNYFITNVTDDLRPTTTTYSMGQLPKSFKRNTFQDVPELKCQ